MATQLEESLELPSRLRRLALQFAGRSIDIAHELAPNRWGITPDPEGRGGVRVNCGKIEVVTVDSGVIYVVVLRSKLNRAAKSKVMEFGQTRRYKSVLDAVPVFLDIEATNVEMRSALRELSAAHRAAIHAAAQTPRNASTKKGHRDAAVDDLSRILRRQLPYPEYSAQGRRESRGAEITNQRALVEGDLRSVELVRRSRVSSARLRRLLSGTECDCCGEDIRRKYGLGKPLIHVHHLKPLAGAKGERKIDVRDLILVCPNCHAVIHSKNPPYKATQVKQMLDRGHGAP